MGTGKTYEVVVISIPRDRMNLFWVCNQFSCCTDRFDKELGRCNVDPLSQSRTLRQYSSHLGQYFGAHDHFIGTVCEPCLDDAMGGPTCDCRRNEHIRVQHHLHRLVPSTASNRPHLIYGHLHGLDLCHINVGLDIVRQFIPNSGSEVLPSRLAAHSQRISYLLPGGPRSAGRQDLVATQPLQFWLAARELPQRLQGISRQCISSDHTHACQDNLTDSKFQ